MIIKNYFILYVSSQEAGTRFYESVLNCPPRLNVPGMTEFELSEDCILGLMPEAGIKRLLNGKIPDPAEAGGIPRAELYLLTDCAQEYIERAVKAGAIELSSFGERDWGHRAAYFYDPDNHIIAFAQEM
ncbi:MAG: VOC family protein [Syntrophothermus sp.]